MSKFSLDTAILDYIPVATSIASPDRKIIYLSPEFIELFGYNLDDIPDMSIWEHHAFPDEIYYKEITSLLNHIFEETIKSKSIHPPIELEVVCKNQEIKCIEVSFNIIQDFIVTFFKDINHLISTRKEVHAEKGFSDRLINALPGIFYLFEKKENGMVLQRWNNNFETITGYNHKELKGKIGTDFSHIPEINKTKESIERAFRQGYSEEELLFKTKNGVLIPFLFTGEPFLNNGKEYLLGIGIDISKLREKEDNINTIFKAFPDIIVVSDYEKNIIFTNDKLEQQTGYTKEFLNENKETLKLYPDEDRLLLDKKIDKLINGKEATTGIFENRIIDKIGQIHWYSGVVAKTTFSGKPALLTINREITQRKYSEQALIESENRMSTVFDSAPVIMMLINEKREILQINKKGIQGLNISQKPSAKIPFGEALKCINSYENPEGCGAGEICRECIIRQTIQDTFNKGAEFEKIPAIIHSESQDYHILLSSSLLKANNPKEVLITVDDITEQKQTEEALKLSREQAVESDKLKSAFLQNMSHEIRTPLNGILGFSGLLDNNELSSEERSYYIEVINQSSNQLLGIVDDILSISRLETGQIEVLNEEVNINNLLKELFTKYNVKANDQGIVLSHETDLDDKQSIAFTDSGKLKQVLDSLLSNAIKFTRQGHVLFGYKYKGEILEFCVEDTGIGIEAEHHTKIFERFQQIDFDSTRVYGGTGLGLTIAKANTELLGGKIWLESAPEIGSKFYFTIPFKPVHEVLFDKGAKGTLTDTTDALPTILVAEDEEINFLFIAEALKGLEFKLIHAFNGEEVVEYVNNNSRIDLVLMDIKMPKMDGYTAFEKIRKIRPELPVIAQTAYAMISDREKAMQAGFVDYLAKPIKQKELLQAIEKVITIHPK
jgi:PAS domain S-box-containing protein